jgi:hypothetical protein
MRKLLVLGSFLGLALPLTAAAQPPPPPPPPGGGGGMTGMEPDEPKMRFDIAVIAGIPQDDIDTADTSPGVMVQFGYTVMPHISIGIGARYFAIQGGPDGVDFSNYDADFSVRYTADISPTLKAFGEAMLIYSTVEVSAMGQSIDGSGVGFGARGGAMFPVGGGRTNLGGAVSFTTASVSGDLEGDAGWLGIEGFVSFGF